MTDTSSDRTPGLSNDNLQALKELANSPRVLNGANTRTLVELTAIKSSSSNIAPTTLVDVRELAESVMFGATSLVAKLDQIDLDAAETARGASPEQDTVAISKVLRGGAAITLAFAIVCLVGTQMSGTILLHPMLAWLLILASIGFYLMGRVKP